MPASPDALSSKSNGFDLPVADLTLKELEFLAQRISQRAQGIYLVTSDGQRVDSPKAMLDVIRVARARLQDLLQLPKAS